MASEGEGAGVGAGGAPQVPVFGPPTDDLRAQVYVAMGICFAAAVITFALRVLTRTVLTTAKMWLDDWLIMVTLIFDTGFLICTVILIENGMGRHVDLTNTVASTNFLKTYIPTACFYATSISWTKLSILAFYWRIFSSAHKIRIPIYIFAAIVICWNIAITLVSIFSCTPVTFWWDRTIPGGHCVDNTAFLLGNSIPNIATDIAILLLPLPFIWRLQQSTSRKIALSGIFLLAGFVCIVSIIRLAIQLRTDFTSPDLTWNITEFVIWTNVETNLAIVSACLPSLRPILSFMRRGRFDTNNGSRRIAGDAFYGNNSRNLKISEPTSSHIRLHSGRDTNATNSEVDEYPLVETKIDGGKSSEGVHGDRPSGIEVSREYMVDVGR